MTETARNHAVDDFERLPAQRAAGQARLEAFVRSGARSYGARRNYDFGPANRENVSGLSPFIRHRLLLEEEVLSATLALHDLKDCEKFVQEVFWRAYFKGWLEHRPSIWFAYRQQLAAQLESLHKDGDLRQRYEAACVGRTGIECFDAWSKELVETGYLHNHARMWFASIWVFTLRLPWELGADFFLRHLLDGDSASNTLGWRWVAGLHTRGKTYLARASNIQKYTDGRFHPAPGELADEAPALREADLPSPITIDDGDRVPVDVRYGLLVTDEDCSPETLDLPQAPAAVIGLNGADARSPLDVADVPRQFSADAVDDALQRVTIAYDVSGDLHDQADWGSTLVRWAREHELDLIATASPTQGGVNDRLAWAERDLAAAGIRLFRLRRDYDRRAWPFTTKGFFRLKKEIPALLKALDVGRRW